MAEQHGFVCEENGVRIDKLLVDNLGDLSRSAVQKIIDSQGVTVNSAVVSKNYKCKAGDEISVVIPDAKPLEAKAENIPLDIVFEDDYLLVVNKPKGMVVHPANGNPDGTLVNALLYHCKDSLSGINGVIRPGIVHRIDKDTSGLLIVAKTDKAHIGLAEQIKEHSFSRAYETVVYGNIKDDEFTVNQPIGRNPIDRKKMAVTMKNSKPAVTHFQVIKRYGNFTHLRCILETGRTHQIRVHTAYIGHPVAGDAVYGPRKVITRLNGQCLHAKHIGFVHPISGEYLEFESELPKYFKDFLDCLENGRI
ncbi:RluA family pseudouridine synthase [uncultured Eubacterium sp.]|uniref:RluA family pseudouridine synthase n=1 Tax=uncultured Eubacterium sp. TaxID=165185 RepID=UPI0015B26A37|nr:RluA family pseudouridine synthase [uncultured Eubacterium sp.]